ncbi:MAG: hypothetical protein AAGN66_02550 [Acidobacteriota bacterium]
MALLARRLGQSPLAALTAAATYGLSGFVLTTLSLYNTVTVVAWWPLVLLGVHTGGRRGIALGGLACGLALLGGEPVTAALGMAPALYLAASVHGARRGLGTAVAVGAVGLAVAAPQLVATLRVLPFTVRGGRGFGTEKVAAYSMDPERLVELLIPFPLGFPMTFDAGGLWLASHGPQAAFIFTLFSGSLALPLAALGARRRRGWAAFAGLGLLLAWSGRWLGPAMAVAGAGLVRYPEKLLFWLALALPLLVGWGLDRARDARRLHRFFGVGAALAGGLLVALVVGRVGVIDWLSANLRPGHPPDTPQHLATRWIIALFVLAACWGIAAPAARRRKVVALACLQILSGLQLIPLVATDATEPYREPPPLLDALGDRRAVFGSELSLLTPRPWARPPDYLMMPDLRARSRLLALDLDPASGVLHGLRYPVVSDLEGIFSPLTWVLVDRLPGLDWPARLAHLRRAGVEAVLVHGSPIQGLPILAREGRPGTSVILHALDPAPRAWWPDDVASAAGVGEAVRWIEEVPDPLERAVVGGPLSHAPGGDITVAHWSADHIELDVESPGGLLVVRRAFHPLLEARADDLELRTLPADLHLLGVEVPAGEHRVVIAVRRWPEALAGLLALLTAAGCGLILWRTRRRSLA